jgi:hypothetical protein
MLDIMTAARWEKAAMILRNRIIRWVVYYGQQADTTAGAQTPMNGGRSYLPLDDILPPPAKNMIKNIREESDDDGEKQRPNSRSFPTRTTGFQQLERKLQS